MPLAVYRCFGRPEGSSSQRYCFSKARQKPKVSEQVAIALFNKAGAHERAEQRIAGYDRGPLPNDPEARRGRLARLAPGRRSRSQPIAAGLQLPAVEAPGEVEPVLAGHPRSGEASLQGDEP